jgi:hypothetical protein
VPVGGNLLTVSASRERERPEGEAPPPVAHAPGSPASDGGGGRHHLSHPPPARRLRRVLTR